MGLMSAVDRRAAETRNEQKRFRKPVEGNSFVRFITAHAKAFVHKEPAAEIAREFWPQDQVTQFLIERSASTPAQVRQPGWAQELAQRVVADVVSALGPVSMGVRLLQEGLVVAFDRAGSVAVPGFVTSSSHTGAWVAERQPIPVYNPNAVAAILNPHKMAAIIVLTREMIESSNAEALIKDLATKSFGRVLDEVLVDGNPESLLRPAGLRYNIVATTPSAATDMQDAFIADTSALLQAISPVAGGGKVALIAGLGRIFRIGVRSYGMYDSDGDSENFVILPSSAVINDYLAVACAGLVAAFGTEPDIEVARVGTLNMDDAPASDPTTPVAPFKSMFQTDSIAIRLRWPVTWALRDPQAFAWMTPTTW